MPTRAPHPCRHPACGARVKSGDGSYCEKHKRQHVRLSDRDRKTSSQRGYNYRWQKARARYLRQYPVCVECLKTGRTEPATVVDHIIPHRGDADLFWDKSNWQALCTPHHNEKTRAEGRGVFNSRAMVP